MRYQDEIKRRIWVEKVRYQDLEFKLGILADQLQKTNEDLLKMADLQDESLRFTAERLNSDLFALKNRINELEKLD